MVSIVIVGFGGMGGYHYRTIKRNKLLRVLGVYDICEKANNKARALGLKVYNSFDEVLADASVNAILISAPNDVHAPYMLQAAAAKKHVLCEKPVTLSSSLLSDMIQAANQNNVVFLVNQNRRQDTDFITICQTINSGALGRVYKIENNVMGSHAMPDGYRRKKECGGGMLLDWGVHLIDQLLYFINSKVEAVFCKNSYVFNYGVDDGCEVRLSFANGCEAKIYIDTNSFCPLPRWVVYGENGSAVLKKWVILFPKGKIISLKERVDKKNKGIQAGNGFTKTMADRSKSTITRRRLPLVKTDRDFIYKNFASAIQNGTPPIVTPTELMRVMQVMEACFLSDQTNQVIKTDI